MNRWFPWVASAALIAVGGGAVYLTTVGLDDTQAATLDYITQAASRTDVTVTSAASGSVASAESYSLGFGVAPSIGTEATAASEQTWTVTDVLVNVGDHVSAGQVLAVADAADLESQIAAAESGLERARVTLSEAEGALAEAPDETSASVRSLNASLINLKLQLADAREMRDEAASGSAAKRQAKASIITLKLQIEAARDERAQLRAEKKAGYPSLTVAVTEAEQSVADLEAQLTDLREQLELATVVAPVDGIVSSLDITAGYAAPSGAAIVVESDTLEVDATVVESDIGSLVVGQAATVSIDALEQDVEGVVTSVIPTTSASSGSVVSYPVTVTLTDPDAGVLAGMSSDVEIVIEAATDVVAVPVTALSGSDGSYTVQVLSDDGSTELRTVTVGLVTETLAEIQSGLSEGEEVVVGTAADRAQSDDDEDSGQAGFGGIGALEGGGGPPAGGPPAGFGGN